MFDYIIVRVSVLLYHRPANVQSRLNGYCFINMCVLVDTRYDSGCLSGCLVLQDFQIMFAVGSTMNASIMVSVPLVASVFASLV